MEEQGQRSVAGVGERHEKGVFDRPRKAVSETGHQGKDIDHGAGTKGRQDQCDEKGHAADGAAQGKPEGQTVDENKQQQGKEEKSDDALEEHFLQTLKICFDHVAVFSPRFLQRNPVERRKGGPSGDDGQAAEDEEQI